MWGLKRSDLISVNELLSYVDSVLRSSGKNIEEQHLAKLSQ